MGKAKIVDMSAQTISISDLVKRLDKRTAKLVIKQLSRPAAADITREDWAAAGRMMAGQPTRGDHSKFATVVMFYLEDNQDIKMNFESYLAGHGKASKVHALNRRPAQAVEA